MLLVFIGLSDAFSLFGTIAWIPEEILQDSFIAALTGPATEDWGRNARLEI